MDRSKLIVSYFMMLNIFGKFYETVTCTFREIVTIDEPTNDPAMYFEIEISSPLALGEILSYQSMTCA